MSSRRKSSPREPGLLVFTIGHSTRPIASFVRLLKSHGVQRVIDIRKIPRSAHNPQFSRERLSPALRKADVHYTHLAGLGGLRGRSHVNSPNRGWRNASFRAFADYMQTKAFAKSIDRCLELARKERVVLMCAEAVPWRCHRSLVADALIVRRVDVREITSGVRARPHTLTPWARVSGTCVTYPAGAAAGS